ncbi:MAG: MltA domain-containing protein, partial [Rickettsiales bacterium]|nr:MltA domain-containing protein [Rickettsiales bacterium]
MLKVYNIFSLCFLALFIVSCSSIQQNDRLPDGMILATDACDTYAGIDCNYEENLSEIPLDLQADIANAKAVEPQVAVVPVVEKKIISKQNTIVSKKIDVQITKRTPKLTNKYNISVEVNDIATDRTIDKLHNPEKYAAKVVPINAVDKIETIKKTDDIAVAEPLKKEPLSENTLQKSVLIKAKKDSDFFLEEVLFSDLPNFRKDNTEMAFSTFIKSCEQFKKTDDRWIKSNHIAIDKSHMITICADAETVKNDLQKYKESEQKKVINGFFMQWFSPYKVLSKGSDNGTFTGYYESHIKGSTVATCDYLYPIYGLPDSVKYQNMTREEIESDTFRGKAKILFWAKSPVDVFLTQIQGSGVVETEDGKQYRIGYAGNNGHNFTGTGAAMQEMGIRPDGGFSMNSVRDYMKKNPSIARKIMNKNKRFIFFRENERDGAVGTFGTTLTPKRTIAVDA